MFSAAQAIQHCMKHTEAQFFAYKCHDICGHSVDKSVRSTVVQLVHMESILSTCAFWVQCWLQSIIFESKKLCGHWIVRNL